MAITKIHPIKSTLDKAIRYIADNSKTGESILIYSYKCNPSTAHIQFMKTREENNTRGSVLARHLIQSFRPGEVSPEKAYEIGKALCEKIFKGEYEFVLATHVDRGHIHNHIIFNNVNMRTGKCYQSNKRSYHKIRYQSDKLCKEQNLHVIDEYYETFKKTYKARGKSWYEHSEAKFGRSYKSKLQLDMDKAIRFAKSWDDFLAKMERFGYEIKHGKHIAFRYAGKEDANKNKTRFTRARRFGEDYTEEKIKERIKQKSANQKPKSQNAYSAPTEQPVRDSGKAVRSKREVCC